MPQREEIMQQALGLPPEDRAFVAAALEHSLAAESTGPLPDDADPGSCAILEGGALLGELQRRSAALRAGLTTARPALSLLAAADDLPPGPPGQRCPMPHDAATSDFPL
ncbi:MAG: addiction module protein [Thermoguttaceae bacterium]|jgi:hypothetical protein